MPVRPWVHPFVDISSRALNSQFLICLLSLMYDNFYNFTEKLTMGDNAPPVESDSWCRTTSGDKASTTFTWTIEDFWNRPENFGEYIKSSTFTITGPNDKVTNWELDLYPKRVSVEYMDGYIALYLLNKERNTEKAYFSLSILNERGQKEETVDFSTEEYISISKGGKQRVGCDNFISHEELKDNPHLLPSGNFTVVCDLTVYGSEATLSGSKFPDEKFATDNNSMKQMSEQFGELFGDEKFSDVKITCGEENFHCHRSILSVRSPVFKAMFQSDMVENISRIVEVKDIKPEVVKEMLHFIYTGAASTETVMDEIGKDLLGAADQYQLELLKKMCEEKLCSSLEVNNSVELLVLADLHNASKLRRMALRLVTRNMDTIVTTDVYKDLAKHHPDLTVEITQSLVQKAGINRKRDNRD